MQVNTYITSATDALGNVLQYDTQKHSSHPRCELATRADAQHITVERAVFCAVLSSMFFSSYERDHYPSSTRTLQDFRR